MRLETQDKDNWYKDPGWICGAIFALSAKQNHHSD
jgi:hypothetical protein